MRSPRSSRSWLFVSLKRSSPSKRISPPAMRPGGCGTSPMIDSAVTLLPQPDSPTMPSVRPRSREKSTPSTARTSPRSLAKSVRSPFTSSRFSVAGNLFLDARAVGLAPGAPGARCAAQIGNEALVRLVVQTAQLRERLGVIVHAQIEVRVRLGGVHQQRCRLLAALVAARGLAGVEGGDQALRKWPRVSLLVGKRGVAHHALIGEHIPRHRVSSARNGATPIDAARAGVL